MDKITWQFKLNMAVYGMEFYYRLRKLAVRPIFWFTRLDNWLDKRYEACRRSYKECVR